MFLKKSLNLRLFMKFLLKSKTSKNHLIHAQLRNAHVHVQCRESIKRSAKGSNFKEDYTVLRSVLGLPRLEL